jgi:NitT/TauT family transport system substrate-binding protein
MQRISRSQLIAGTAALVALPRLAGSQTLDKIRFCGVPLDDVTAVLWAIKAGFYTRAGLDVEFVPTASGSVATAAVISGTYEMGKASPIATCAAHLRNVPIAAIGTGAIWNGVNVFATGIVAADSTIKTGADLNGKIVAASGLSDIIATAMDAWVDKTGGDWKSLKWVEIPNAAIGAAVAEKRVAAAHLTEPLLSSYIESGKVKVLAPFLNAVGSLHAATLYLARPDWIRANRSVVDRFLRATYDSAAYTNTHPAETAPMLAEITKIPLPTIQRMGRSHAATTSDSALLQPPIDAAAKYGQLSRSFPAKELYIT